jgi:hypothetical protein
MLYSFILETLIFLSLGAIILVLARALPRIEDESSAGYLRKGKMSGKIPLDKIDESLNLVLHKALRRMKIFIMKADNLVTNKLKSFRSDSKKDGNGLPMP